MEAWNILIGLLAVVLLLMVGFSLYGAYQVISPARCEQRDDPAGWGMTCEEIEFKASDGTRLAAWLARASGQGGPAVIVVHGHGGNRHTSIAYGHFLYPEFTVLLPDLRGHGESDGRHTSAGYLERLDLVGAARYLRDLGYGPIGVLGVSMGAATAILAAAESSEIDAVVADSPFAALRHAVREGARGRGYPRVIIRPLAYLSCQTAAWRLRYPMRKGDPIGVVASIAPRPLLLIHGAADDLILVEDAYSLYAAAGDPKELWVLPGVEHARAIEVDGPRYRERVLAFFRKVAGGREHRPVRLVDAQRWAP